MSLNDIQSALQTTLQKVDGIKTVYTSLPRNQQGVFPSIVISIDKTHEVSATMGRPGKRHVHYTVNLYIQSIDADPNEFNAQNRFNDLLDAIDVQLRGDQTLGGTVLKSAWERIDTDIYDAVFAGQGQSLLLRAIKSFDVLVEITQQLVNNEWVVYQNNQWTNMT